MRTKFIKKKILLAFCLGSMFVASPAYATTTATGYSVPGNNVTNSTGEFSITRTSADDITVVGVINNGYDNFTLSNSAVTITANAESTDTFANGYGIFNKGITTINGTIDITVADTGGSSNATTDGYALADAYARASGIYNGATATIAGSADISVAATGGGTNATSNTYENVSADADADARGIYNSTGTTTIGKTADITVTATSGSANATSNGNAFANADAKAYGIVTADTTIIGGDADMTVAAIAGSAKATLYANGYASAVAVAEAYGIDNINFDTGTITISGAADITVAATGGSANVAESANASAVATGIDNSSTTTIGGATDITVAATAGSANAASYASACANATGIDNSGTTTIGGATDIIVAATAGSANATSGAETDAVAEAYGIDNSGTTTIGGDSNITVTATGGSGTFAPAYAYGIYNLWGSVSLEKNATVMATATASAGNAYAYSLYTSGGTININQATESPYTVQLTGDVLAKGGTINVDLNNSNSFLQGNVITNGGTVNLILANKAVWQPVYDNRNGTITYATANSLSGYSAAKNTVSTLTLNGGIIDLTWDNASRTSARTLNIGTLNGNGGTLEINTDVANSTGDTVAIATLSSPATLQVAVVYDRSLSTITQPTTIYAAGYTPVSITTGANNLTLTGVTTDSGVYSLTPSFSGTTLTSLAIGASSNTKAAASSASIQANMLQTSVNHLRKRLGDLRTAPETQEGIWARVYSGEISNDKYTSIESDYKGIQLGYDKSRQAKDGRTYTGGALSLTNADNSFYRGSGESKDYDLALYQTWIGSDGHYYNIIAKHGRLTSDYHVIDLSNNYSTADYHTGTSSLSVEYGYRKQLKDGWYMEPQYELTYGHINGVNYTTSSDMRVKQDGIDCFTGRLGLGFGKKLTNGTNLYTSLSVLHEFNSDQTIKADNLTYSQDIGGTWYEFILGTSCKLSSSSNGYIDVEKLFGGHVGSNWQINARCQWSF